jgi:hypothetical protein
MLRGMLSSIDKLDMPTQQNQTTKDRDSHDW